MNETVPLTLRMASREDSTLSVAAPGPRVTTVSLFRIRAGFCDMKLPQSGGRGWLRDKVKHSMHQRFSASCLFGMKTCPVVATSLWQVLPRAGGSGRWRPGRRWMLSGRRGDSLLLAAQEKRWRRSVRSTPGPAPGLPVSRVPSVVLAEGTSVRMPSGGLDPRQIGAPSAMWPGDPPAASA